MGKYNVYAGYYELFVTDKELPLPCTLQATFDTSDEAWEYAEECEVSTHIDVDIYCDMFGYDIDYVDIPTNVFKVDTQKGDVVMLTEETIPVF